MSLFGNQTVSRQNRRLLGFHPQTSISGQPLPLLFGTRKLAGNVIWTGDWKSTPVKNNGGKGGGKASGGGKGGGGNLTYKMAAIIELCRGPITRVGRIWQDKTEFRNIGGTRYHAVGSTEALPDINLEFFPGFPAQAPWGYLTTNHADEALGYSETCYTASPSFELGESGTLSNYAWELTGPLADFNGGLDCDPTAVAYALMTDESFGSGLLDASVGDLTEASDYAVANGLFCSLLVDTQRPAAQWLDDLALIGNWAYVNSEGKIKLRSYGDTTATGNGASFSPNITPIYDLDDDDFLCGQGEEPVSVSIPTIRDSYNSVSLEWLNRENGYNEEPVQEQDDASIQQYGLRPMSVISAHAICDHKAAAKICSLATKNATYKRRQFHFTLGWQYGLLEPMDLVTITDLYLGLNLEPVRILSIEEDENGQLDITAEEFIFGLATPSLHPKQTTAGYGPGYFAQPGFVNTPVFVEAPDEITQDIGHEILIALSGGPNWGGCTVWESADGTSYEAAGRFEGPSVMGKLTASLAVGSDPDTTHTLSVDLTESFGDLETVSLIDADQNRTLLALDGELISYQTATLTGVNKYDLTYLRRGVYGTQNRAHSVGELVASVFDAVFSFPYNAGDVGQIRYFKFTSFNRAGQQEQSLADVAEYQYRIVGTESDAIGPDPWLPSAQTALIDSDPIYQDRASFKFDIEYVSDAAGNPSPQQDIYGFYPTNELSTICAPPILSTTVATVPTGGTIPPGSYELELVAIDNQTPQKLSARSHTVKVVVPSGTSTNKIVVTVTSWDANSTGAFGYLRKDGAPFALSAIATSTTSTITFFGIGVTQPPPDTRADHLHVQSTEEVAGWRWILPVTSVSGSGPVLTFAGMAMATNEFQGCILSLMGQAVTGPGIFQPIVNLQIASNTATTVTLTTSVTGKILAGDFVACRLKLSTFSSTQFGDAGIVNSVATAQGFPSGYPVDGYAGNYAYVIGGTGAGQFGTIKSNTASVFTLTVPLGIALDATSLVVVLNQAFAPDFSVPPFKSDGNDPFVAPQVATVALPNYAGRVVFTRVLTESIDNVVGDATYAPFREVFIAGKPSTDIGLGTFTITGESEL